MMLMLIMLIVGCYGKRYRGVGGKRVHAVAQCQGCETANWSMSGTSGWHRFEDSNVA